MIIRSDHMPGRLQFPCCVRKLFVEHWSKDLTLHRQHQPTTDATDALTILEDPANDLERVWNREHDEYVTRRLLELIEPEVTPPSWLAFRRQVVDGQSAAIVAAELGITPNAALIAKSRVLRRLREEARGLTD